MSNPTQVAKPAGPIRPTASDGGRGAGLRDCDAVEVSVGVLMYMREIATNARRNVRDVETHLERALADRALTDEERIRALAKALNACDSLEYLREGIDRLIPEAES